MGCDFWSKSSLASSIRSDARPKPTLLAIASVIGRLTSENCLFLASVSFFSVGAFSSKSDRSELCWWSLRLLKSLMCIEITSSSVRLSGKDRLWYDPLYIIELGEHCDGVTVDFRS